MDLIKRASQRITERLTWCIAHRDRAGIAKDLAEGKDISEVYGLGKAGLFDEFFYFLDQFGIMDLFLGIDPQHTQRTNNLTFPAVILIYVMRVVAISAHALERFFNRVICILAAKSFFPKRVDALLDSSEIQSTQLCEGCGKVSKEKAPQLRHQRPDLRRLLWGQGRRES